MKNNISNTLKLFSACVVLAASCVWADPLHTVIVKVPFDFTVCNHGLPAGDYEVTIESGRTIVLVRGEGKDATTFALTHGTQANQMTTRPKLVFKRYGDRYFLAEIWPLGTTEGRVLPKSRIETELAGATGKPEVVGLVAIGAGLHKPIR